jgi:HlyD family secretion protein
LKKWLLWGIPAAILIGLLVWRFKNMPEVAAGGPGGGGAPGGGAGRASGAGGAGGTRGTGGATGPGGGGGRGGPAAVEVAAAGPRTITVTLQTVGNVESPYKIQVSPKTTGRIEYLEAREGDPVTKGQVLLRIDPAELQGAANQAAANVAEERSRLAQAKITQGSTNVGISSQIKQQQAAVASALADLNQVKRNYDAQVQAAQSQVNSAESVVKNALANLDQQNANYQNAQTKYERVLNLYKQGFIAAQDVDDAKTAVAVQKGAVGVAQGQVDSARSQLNVQKQNLTIAQRKGTADIAASSAKLTQARATLDVANANRSQTPAYKENLAALQSSVNAALGQLQQAQSRLRDTVVRASISGVVTARKADPGGLATPGTGVLEVQFMDWLYVTATIPIESGASIHEGQEAEITFDSIPGKTFTGPISNINPAADPLSRQFSIRIRLANPSRALRPGMYARVGIVTSKVKAPVVVPREAVKTDSEGKSTVTVVDEESVAHTRDVILGVGDAKGVEVKEGVKAGDKVVTLSNSPPREGQKVMLGGGRGRRPGSQDGTTGGQGTGSPSGRRQGAEGGERRRRGGTQ